MCHFRSRLRGFIEELSGVVWHLGCVDEPAAGVGRPVRTVQTRQTGQDACGTYSSKRKTFVF